jgi:hypothetical protein
MGFSQMLIDAVMMDPNERVGRILSLKTPSAALALKWPTESIGRWIARDKLGGFREGGCKDHRVPSGGRMF